MIFVTTVDAFKALQAAAIQDIFRHRHILVLDVPEDDPLRFDAAGLSKLGPLRGSKEVQGKVSIVSHCLRFSIFALVLTTIPVAHLRRAEGPNQMLKPGSIQTLLDVANAPDSNLVLNLLDCPMGGVTVQAPPRYDAFASDEWAATMTKGMPYVGTSDLTDDLAWGTAGLKNASSGPHIGDEGFATVVTVRVGSKWWVVAEQKRKGAAAGEAVGDMGTVNSFGGTWAPHHARSDVLEHEGVLLTPGCVL